jgi:diguanylate cyclase (GGDEF)-like protein
VRRTALVTLALGAACLVAGVGSSLTVEQLAREHERSLTAQLQRHVGITQEYFQRAATVTQLSAHNPVFAGVYAHLGPGERPRPDQVEPVLRAQIQDGLNYLETLFPGQVSEACLIDLDGAELARVVTGRIAGVPSLSRDERGNPFFAPTLAAPDDTVYQARPYVSPDTHVQVVSNSIVLRTPQGRPLAVLHFEVTVSSLREHLVTGDQGFQLALVDAATGSVVLDNGPVDRTRTASLPRYPVAGWSSHGLQVQGDRLISYQRVPHTASNANDWFVVVSAPAAAPGWRSPFDLGPALLVLLALGLLAFSGTVLARDHRLLADQARLDELTGLANRRTVRERLEQDLAGRREFAAVLLIDLDRFKQVNDTLGHAVGDQLLLGVTRRFSALCGPRDLVGRLGGDEFGYILAGPAGSDEAMQRAREIARVVQEPHDIDGHRVQVGGSVGVAMVDEHGRDATTLLRRADVAMYEAKRRRLGAMLFTSEQESRPVSTLAMETSILRAIDRREFVLHYQPQVNLRTGRVIGVEALVRWQHPEHGLILPAEFIPTCEDSGLIVGLTKHVLELALDQICQWRGGGREVPAAVNLAARNVADPQLPQEVLRLLTERGLPANLLRLELTETDLLGDAEAAKVVLEELRALGVALAIDDFGTGFASLSQLRELPFEELKIDRSFVTNLDTDPQARHIVDSVMELAHGLGLTVTAEGVETRAVLDVLVSVGCDVVQGYFFSRPLPAQAAFEWIQAHDPASVVPRQPTSPTMVSAASTRR